jgi:hypothetical protein
VNGPLTSSPADWFAFLPTAYARFIARHLGAHLAHPGLLLKAARLKKRRAVASYFAESELGPQRGGLT